MKAKNTFFQSWAKNMVLYGLDAGLGQFFMNAPETSCLYQLGNFIFPAGQVDPNLWQEFSKKYSLADKVIISEKRSWQEFLDSQTDLQQFTRYAFADRASFDTEALEKWQSSLPVNYHLCPIDKESYERLAEEVWSQDLQGDFPILTIFKRRVALAFYSIPGRKSSLLYQRDWSIMEPLRLKLLPSRPTKDKAWPKSWVPR